MLGRPPLLLELENGTALGFECVRQLGGIDMARDRAEELEAQALGPDALEISRDRFIERIRGRRVMIETDLMDQSVIAGLGNGYSDEVSFQARIDPRASTDAVDDPTLERLYRTMCYVFDRAVDAGARLDAMPRS